MSCNSSSITYLQGICASLWLYLKEQLVDPYVCNIKESRGTIVSYQKKKCMDG